MSVMHLCETCHSNISVHQLLYAVKSYTYFHLVNILVNILVMPRYFSHTEVLIIKVYRKKVLLIPPNPITCINTENKVLL